MGGVLFQFPCGLQILSAVKACFIIIIILEICKRVGLSKYSNSSRRVQKQE